MQVLWVIKGLGPGGAENLLLTHARVSQDADIGYTVAYALPWKDHLVAGLREQGVDVVPLGRGRRGGAWPLRLARLVRSGRFDVVHAHSPLLAAVARLAVRSVPASRRPVMVSTEHNVWPQFSAPTRWVNAVTVRLDDHRWAVSAEVAASGSAGSRRRTEVLEHGIVLSERPGAEPDARSAARASLGLAPGVPVVMTVANLRAAKDYPTLLAAARRVVDRLPEAAFVSVGQGPLAAELAAESARLGLAGSVRFLGYRDDVPRLLPAADVFCLSSRHEGLPVALMEAYAAGVPVVSTAVGGIPAVLTDGVEGRLVPPGDPTALAAALLDLLHDPDRRAEMGADAGRAAGRFDARAAVRRQEETYRHLVRAEVRQPRPAT